MLERVALTVIAVYQRLLSPLWPPTCRFHPSCSTYTRDAILQYGLGQGCWLGLKRLARCHPWHPGGHDPVK
jgi:putative membrane protein insertion efficiency factor